jgi:hypothetical protein
MVVDTGTAILILGAFVLPGFIALTLRERLYVVRGEDGPFERLLSALLYSAIVYGTLLLTAHLAGLQKSDLVEFQSGQKPLSADLLAASAIFLILPGLIALLGSRWMSSRNLRPRLLRLVGSSDAHGSASAWNITFREVGPCLVRATLTDGRLIGGLYDEASVSGYSEQTRDLYLSERWQLNEDNWFVGPMDHSLGVWLSDRSIVSLEFYGSDNFEQRNPENQQLGSNHAER